MFKSFKCGSSLNALFLWHLFYVRVCSRVDVYIKHLCPLWVHVCAVFGALNPLP